MNTQLIELYWTIGREIISQQARQGWGTGALGHWGTGALGHWGTGVLVRLAGDLRSEFPQMKGFSSRNHQYMRAFAVAWPETDPIVQQAVAGLPWGHITVLLDKLDSSESREWYASAAVKNGWSRNVLLNQIMNRTVERTGSAPSNFTAELTPADSDLARQIAKDPYVFDFLELTEDAAERDLEQALMDRIVDTLRELGTGFAFVGRQVHFDVGGDDFYLDLLFFHVEQLRYVVIELKTGKFQPEHAGQLGFYISLVDDKLRRAAHAC
ncbi:PDDEXK nuclease domain-containing protein [Cryobacterium lactosi]|uniref:PDDEXK nuclease domain-containing protein n=1 Tax=Cryobacterium lactosi TaxID=1259202 RepID=UPI0030B9DE57